MFSVWAQKTCYFDAWTGRDSHQETAGERQIKACCSLWSKIETMGPSMGPFTLGSLYTSMAYMYPEGSLESP